MGAPSHSRKFELHETSELTFLEKSKNVTTIEMVLYTDSSAHNLQETQVSDI